MPPNISDETDGGTTEQASLDARADTSTAQPKVETLMVTGAAFENRSGVGGKYYYSIDFALENPADDDATSLDTLSFDFGDGKKIAISEPACAGKFSVASGKSKSLEVQIGVNPTTGALTEFSIFCSPTQYFGGATGNAPPTASFAGPIAIDAGGKTTRGTFTATGSASRTN